MISSVKSRIFAALVFFLASAMSLQSVAAEPINTLERSGLFGYDPSGVAIRGADTVAYFTQMQYVPGSDEFTTQWNGATWKFSSQDHLDLFIADPDKYAPQYGGYCAYGVAQDYLVKIEPEAWSIVDGKLYLNYSANVQEEWEQDIPGFIAQANKNFTGLLAE
ncbi:MAG: YHS domain-containing (seleno)protein [Pseudomonadota bacterium]